MNNKDSFIDKIFLENWIPFAIIACLGTLLYFQVFFFDFSYLDDNVLILGNQYFLSNFMNIGQAFLTDVFHLFNHSAFYYRPILTLSFMIDYHLGGITPFIYHFMNVVLHILSACLVFILLKKFNYRRELAFLFSIIFLVHPVLTQAVAWIPGRNDSLLAIFVLLTFIFFLKFLKEEKGKKVTNMIWSLAFFFLALFTKESALAILPVLLFYLFFIYKKENKSLPFDKFYFFFWSIGVLIVWGFLRHIALLGSSSLTLVEMIKSLFFNLPAVVQFVGKIFFPFNLSVLPVMQDTTFVYGIIAIILLAIMIFYTKTKRWNFILFGLFWFLVFLLPSFIRPNSALMADFVEHRLYVPIIGIFIMFLETDFIKKIDFKKVNTLTIASIVLIILSIITLVHSRSFADKLSFWQNAAQNSPHYPLAHRNLGAMEYLAGDMNNAEKEFKTALELNPNEEMAHNNLGLVYANEGKLAESETEYKKELAINPYYDNAYYNLGLLYWNEKRFDEAKASWQKTLQINPNYAVAPEILQILQK